MTISLDELEVLAKAASVPDAKRFHYDDWLAFIAACDPATILKLLAERRALQARHGDLARMLNDIRAIVETAPDSSEMRAILNRMDAGVTIARPDTP